MWRFKSRQRMQSLPAQAGIGVAVLALVAVAAVGAAAEKGVPTSPSVDWFEYDECNNRLAWETNTEVLVAYYQAHMGAWQSERVYPLEPGSNQGHLYEIAGPPDDLASTPMLCEVRTDGATWCDNVAERTCDMAIFTPAPTPGGSGAAFVYDGVTFTQTNSGSGLIEVDLHATSGGSAIDEPVALFVALVATGSYGPANDLYFSDGRWLQYPPESLPTTIINYTDETGVTDLSVINDTSGDLDCRLIVILPSGGLEISETFTVPGQFAP